MTVNQFLATDPSVHTDFQACDVSVNMPPHQSPLWLAPEQVCVIPLSERFDAYRRKIEATLQAKGCRVYGDYRPDKVGCKIGNAQLERIPCMLVVGDKEQSAGILAIRDRVHGDIGAVPVAEFLVYRNPQVPSMRTQMSCGIAWS
jgi:threonyl-tRNA synthetase